MFKTATIIQDDILEPLLTQDIELQTYKELVTQLKQYYSMVELKKILSISEATHNRYLNGSSVSPSILIHLTLLFNFSTFRNTRNTKIMSKRR